MWAGNIRLLPGPYLVVLKTNTTNSNQNQPKDLIALRQPCESCRDRLLRRTTQCVAAPESHQRSEDLGAPTSKGWVTFSSARWSNDSEVDEGDLNTPKAQRGLLFLFSIPTLRRENGPRVSFGQTPRKKPRSRQEPHQESSLRTMLNNVYMYTSLPAVGTV